MGEGCKELLPLNRACRSQPSKFQHHTLGFTLYLTPLLPLSITAIPPPIEDTSTPSCSFIITPYPKEQVYLRPDSGTIPVPHTIKTPSRREEIGTLPATCTILRPCFLTCQPPPHDQLVRSYRHVLSLHHIMIISLYIIR
jgi:hypothetical protein